MNDKRTINTYKTLKNALFSELEDKSFEEIKIVDLCERANIHRTTFYSHFNDKYELLEYAIKDLQQDFESNIKNVKIHLDIKGYYYNLISIFLDHLYSNKEIYISILKKNNDSIMINSIYSIIKKDIKNKINTFYHENNSKIDIMLEFYIGGISNIITWWIRNNMHISKENLLKEIKSLLK